jgi:hypothetical protein
LSLQGFSPETSRNCSSQLPALLSFSHIACGPIAETVPALCPRLQGFAPTSGPLPPTEFLRLPEPDPLLSFHTFGFFFEHLGTAFTTPALMTFSADSSGDFAGWPLAYQSMFNRSLLSPAPLPHS